MNAMREAPSAIVRGTEPDQDLPEVGEEMIGVDMTIVIQGDNITLNPITTACTTLVAFKNDIQMVQVYVDLKEKTFNCEGSICREKFFPKCGTTR